MSRQFGGTPGVQHTNRWQDWCNLVLAIWLFISPWILAFSGGAAAPGGTGAGGPAPGVVGPAANVGSDAAWNAWVLGVLIFLVALSAIGRMEFWQEWINLLLGAWVFVAPWALGFAGMPNASWNHWIVGALVFLISVSNLSSVRRSPTTADMAHAGDKPPPSQPPNL